MFFIPFIAQCGIPIGGMFFILYAASITTGYLNLFFLFLVIFAATILADIITFFIGRKLGSTSLIQKFQKHKHIEKMYNDGVHFIEKRGELSVFLTRFLITGIGPYINYILGMNNYSFKRFIKWAILGEFLYAAELVLLGYVFDQAISDIVSIFTDFTLIIVILFIMIIVGKKIFVYEVRKHRELKEQ